MIVKDKKAILDHAEEAAKKFLYIIDKETKKFLEGEDAASQIYFNVYCMSISMAKIAMGVEKFCEMYGSNKMDSTALINWIMEVTKEIINENSKNVH